MLSSIFGIVAFASLVAFINERLVELIIKPLLVKVGGGDFVALAAFALGTGLSIGSGIDFISPLAALLDIDLLWPWIGFVISGAVVGGGSNFLHDVLAFVKNVMKGDGREPTTTASVELKVESQGHAGELAADMLEGRNTTVVHETEPADSQMIGMGGG